MSDVENQAVGFAADGIETRSEYMVRLAVELRQIGVSEVVTRQLLTNHPLEVIDRQLLYLPYRKAKRRSSLIVAAIKDDYERPANMPEDVLFDVHEG